MNSIAPVSRMTFIRPRLKLFSHIAVGLCLAGNGTAALAQANSWTKPSSGNWEEPFWSAGVLPGAGQNVLLTNAGWKAVMISPGTAQNFPQSLTVNSLTIASPADSFNTLFLNHAGTGTPLTVNSIALSNNAVMTLAASALHLNGPAGIGMSIGGEFNQNDSSLVTGNQLDIGYIGPGVYNLNSGTLSAGHVWLGGGFGGVFNQFGGNNAAGVVHLEAGGTYNFYGGDFDAAVYFGDGSLFHQKTGVLDAGLTLWRGAYLLEHGEKHGALEVPISDGFAGANGSAWAMQTGGTNFGTIQLGYYGGGSYFLSNGVVRSPFVTVLHYGHFFQWGGSQTITGGVSVAGGWVDRGDRELARYSMSAGILSTPELYLDTGSFTHDGGTNLAGELRFANSTHNYYHFGAGHLEAVNTTLESSWVGGFYQNGGTHIVRNQLAIYGNDLPLWEGFVLRGGELIVSNIVVHPRGIFRRMAGTVVQSGMLTLANARFYAGTGVQQFGPLQLNTGGDTNTTLHLPAEPGVVQFGHSSGVIWSGEPWLIIENWAGSLAGGGSHRVIFGNSESALTAQQLERIRFNNPAGLSAGVYSAVILGTGEVVPEADGGSSGGAPPQLRLSPETDGSMTLQVQGMAGQVYAIEASTNLVDWVHLADQTNFNGALVVTDHAATNHVQRFYRAVVRP